ncbi:MAG TPA: hypothetical protein VMP01_14575 [Pirellulaceae bacterium]|nr:hypothetical protein [Pirellulaceae bacterium]
MRHSPTVYVGGVLALLALVPLDCRRATSESTPPPAENSVDVSSELRAGEVTDVDKNAPPEKSADHAGMGKPRESPSLTAHRAAMDRIYRERWVHVQADWKIALRTDTATVVPCQPLYVTIKVTNATTKARKLDELFGDSEFWLLAGRSGEEPRVVVKGVDVELVPVVPRHNEEPSVTAGASVFIDHMLTVERVDGGWVQNPADGSWSRTPDAKRIFSEPGEYYVYAAVVEPSKPFEVLRSEPLAVTVRKPTQSEVPYVEFFREGRQIPPYYGFSGVDAQAFEKLKSLPQRESVKRIVAFQREVNAKTIDTLRAMLAKHPDPPIADDMRHYLMVKLISSARRADERGRQLGIDRDVIAEAAQVYLEIAPERKQLRRRSIKRWHGLTSHQYPLDEARPVFQILASWKTWSPFYEDEVQSQAALAKIMDEIEAPLAQQARQRAAAPPPKPKPLPTD